MKKLFYIAVAAMILLASCSQKKDMKILVSYFSATGTTEAVAKDLASVLNADIHEIAPAIPYTAADLDWRDSTSRSTVEMTNLASRPELAEPTTDVNAYDVIFVGFPIWWYTAPTIINSYLESGNFNGKTVIAFATSGSSTIDKSCEDLKATYPDIIWKDGKLLNGATEADLLAWKKELGL